MQAAMKQIALLTVAVLAIGCRTSTITIPRGAPMMLTEPVVIRRPFVRQAGRWVQSDQDGEAQPGEVVQFLPAARPASK